MIIYYILFIICLGFNAYIYIIINTLYTYNKYQYKTYGQWMLIGTSTNIPEIILINHYNILVPTIRLFIVISPID